MRGRVGPGAVFPPLLEKGLRAGLGTAGQEGGGVWGQSSLRPVAGLGVKALEPHPRRGHYQKPLGLGCLGRGDSAAASALASTARPIDCSLNCSL